MSTGAHAQLHYEESFLNPDAKFCVVLPTFPLCHGLSGLCVGVCDNDRSVFSNWLGQMHDYREAFGLPARSPMVVQSMYAQ